MTIFSMRIRNKGKHKFTRTKVSEIVEDKINFLSPYIQNEDFG